jgi:hypothetical protein
LGKNIRVHELMQELGPSLAAIEWLIQESESSWSLGMSNGQELGVSFCTVPSRFLLTAMIGRPEETERQTMYTTMLCSNLLYAEERALRVALTGPEGDLMLISECIPDEWTVAEISDCIARFSDTVSRFTDVMSRMEDVLPSDESPFPHHMHA